MWLGPGEDRREQKVFEGVKPAREVCAVPLSKGAAVGCSEQSYRVLAFPDSPTLQQGSHVTKLWLVLLELTAGPGIPGLSSHPGVRVLS